MVIIFNVDQMRYTNMQIFHILVVFDYCVCHMYM